MPTFNMLRLHLWWSLWHFQFNILDGAFEITTNNTNSYRNMKTVRKSSSRSCSVFDYRLRKNKLNNFMNISLWWTFTCWLPTRYSNWQTKWIKFLFSADSIIIYGTRNCEFMKIPERNQQYAIQIVQLLWFNAKE